MTTEEKAKAYDEALEKAKEMMDNCSFETTKVVCQELFPELVESEDERIRKEIIEFLRSQIEDGNSVGWDRWIAYLEKQKEASKAIEAVERIDKYIDEHLANAHDMKDSNPEKKYYRGWDDALGKMAGILQDVYSGEKQKEEEGYESVPVESTLEYKLGFKAGKDSEKQKEQKHPDGCFTCDEYKKGYEEGRRNGFTAGYNKAMKEQKPAEWSEEDAGLIDLAVAAIEDFYDKSNPIRSKIINWLKSLRPSWKPTYEQMEALRKAVNKLADTEVADSVRLSIMYDHLKELM